MMHETGRQGWAWWAGVLMLAALIAPAAADASTYRWQFDGSGNWNDPAQWALVDGPAGAGYPNQAGDVAVFDVAPTAGRTVTIPDGVTITIGRLEFDYDSVHELSITAGGGAASLVFDNLGEDAVIESDGTGERSLMAAQLNADLVFTGNGPDGLVSTAGLSESGGSRNVTVLGGTLMFSGANTYSGTTTVANGSLQISAGMAFRIPGPLIVGDGVGAASSATVGIVGAAINPSAPVTVNRDGSATFGRSFSMGTLVNIGDLSVFDGSLSLLGSGTHLRLGNLTMEGGALSSAEEVSFGFTVTGSVTATSTATGPARLGLDLPGALILESTQTDFTVADGPQQIDLQVGIAIGAANAGSNLSKLGPGLMRLTVDSPYTGTTTIVSGTVWMDRHWMNSAVSVGTLATLGGTGGAGSISAAPDSTVAVGGAHRPGLHGLFETGSVAFNGANVSFDIAGTLIGVGHDALFVSGTISLGNSALSLTSSVVLPPNTSLTIMHNDEGDLVNGTFADLPEGAVVTADNGARFRISYAGGDGNEVVLVSMSPMSYFLSEGATGTFFDEDVLIANPNTVAAPVTLTFYLPGGGILLQQQTVPAQSRLTIAVDGIPGLQATSPSVEVTSDNLLPLGVERTMFWDRTHYGGHTANAVPRLEREWLFAEGAQNNFFQTFLLLVNPNPSADTATVTFLREGESSVVKTIELPANSRVTVSAGDYAELAGRSFGMTVSTLRPIAAERAMYFASTPARLWSGGHANVGSPAPSATWFHPEGASGTFFSTFILVSNPQDTPANVTYNVLLPNGDTVQTTRTIGPKQRVTVNPVDTGDLRLTNAAFSTVVTSDVPVVSERAMYWPGDDTPFGEGHASSGLTTTALDWVLAEGRSGGTSAYSTYILLANPQSTAANVTVTFLRLFAAPIVKTYTVDPTSRFNIDVGGMVPELQNQSFGARVEVTNNVPIAVERSMYWNAGGRFWAGGSNALASAIPQ
jgi:autotransporter-associated beta strand protein